MTPPNSPARSAATRILLWALPPLVCLAAFYPAFQVWFLRDDFRWLGLRHLMAESATPLATMFAPYAQGTIRALSERLFFVGLSSLFDLDAIPFRACVFLTQFANLAMMARLGARLSGLRAAGCVAACAWALSPRLAVPMYWTSAYNQILCAFFILAALTCLDRYLETGKAKWLVAQYAAFLLSFGALELGVVYPAAATLWIWIVSRRGASSARWRTTLPLWIAATAFAAAQLLLIPKSASPTYQLFFDARMIPNLATYSLWVMGPSRMGEMIDESLRVSGFLIAGALLLALLLFAFQKRSAPIAFCIAWFAAFLAPVLPLANHVSDYYLAIPAIGVCWLIGWMLTDWCSRGTTWKALAIALGASVAIGSVWENRETTLYYAGHSGRMQRVVRAVTAAHRAAPAKIILLGGVDRDLYAVAFDDEPFYAAGAAVSSGQPLVFLTPGSEAGLQAEFPGVSRYVFSADRAATALENRQAIVFQVTGESIREVTAAYRAIAQSQRAAMRRTSIELGDSSAADLLGSGWYPAEKGFRWMAKAASARLAGPQTAQQRLHIDGFVPAGALANGPLTLLIKVDAKPAGALRIDTPDSLLTADFALPQAAIGQREITITLEVSRTFRPPGDPRELGLILSKLAIR